MKLLELSPRFICRIPSGFKEVEINESEGLMFVCPKCFEEKGHGHSIICWKIGIPLDEKPGPGRWNFKGTSFDDLNLINGSSSIFLKGACGAHFFIKNGEIESIL